ncbi:DNA-directed DNA polymerase [Melia azedarach]|uniref:DNA-directed DNA polymerase n=1 Tax=Melia azedarach TaxID=155640 RepID=A0ACC1YB63_MELAZ|nr:DNA-directed DNA polymerase [Melia azedarach]
MVQQNQYGGLSHEDPNIHLAMFLEVCDTIKMNGVDQDLIRIRLFPFSLKDNARGRLQSLEPAGGTLLSKMAEETYALFEEMACNNYQWPSERSIGRRAAGVHEMDQMAVLSAQVTALSNQINNFTTRETSASQDKELAASFSCVDDGFEQEQCQYINNRNDNFRPSNNLPTHYHSGLRNHENFFYGNQRNALQPHQPSATTLRNGKELEPPKPKENEARADKMKKSEVNSKKVEDEAQKEVSKPYEISFPNNPPLIEPPLSFPQRFQKKKLDAQFFKFLEVFKMLHINILFANALEQMPNYAKFIKEVMSKKRRLEEYETVKLIEECSSILQRKLPKKEKDRGSFTSPCTIGNLSFENALCDLGASINLMPLSVFQKLRLGEVKPMTISL